jgi:hypothetical protein|tara:strand:+ start:81 stop:1316 length:1236 start_codon:yes stop_codon:yes gene_type:complete
MGTKNLDDAYLEYYKYKNSDREYVLTVNGYEPLERNFIENVAFYSKDIGKGVVRGGAKLSEGILSLLTAASEKFILGPEAMKKLDPEGDGLVKDLGEFYKNNVYSKIGETETLAGGFAEGLSQFLVPGVGYYKLFNGLIKAKGVLPFITRALSAEAATVGTAQVAGEGNFVSFLADAFQIETKDAETLTSRYLEYLRTPEDVSEGVDADKVLAEKWKAIQGDIALGPVGEAMGPLLTKFFSTIKKMKKETVKKIDTSYRMEFHQAKGPMDENPIRLDNLTKDINGEQAGYPNDFYTTKGKQIYAPGPKFKDDEFGIANNESYNIIKKAKDNPDMEVTIYRAVPNEDNITTINQGDFVTLSKKYAELHGASGYGSMGNDAGKILEMKVKVKDLYWDGNDVNEFGYFKNGGNK